MSWTNQLVRHADGRLGRIRETSSFVYTELNISAIDGVHEVALNARGRDTGETNWFWYCAEFDGGPHWCPLGDHWKSPGATPCTPEEIAEMEKFKAEQTWRSWPTTRAAKKD